MASSDFSSTYMLGARLVALASVQLCGHLVRHRRKATIRRALGGSTAHPGSLELSPSPAVLACWAYRRTDHGRIDKARTLDCCGHLPGAHPGSHRCIDRHPA